MATNPSHAELMTLARGFGIRVEAEDTQATTPAAQGQAATPPPQKSRGRKKA